MRFRDYPDFILCAWTGFEAMRRLGFSADQIYFVAPSDESFGREVFLVLKAQGKDFNMNCGPTDLSEKEISSLWTDFANKVADRLSKEGDDEELHEIWESSACYLMAPLLLKALTEKGFVIPRAVN